MKVVFIQEEGCLVSPILGVTDEGRMFETSLGRSLKSLAIGARPILDVEAVGDALSFNERPGRAEILGRGAILPLYTTLRYPRAYMLTPWLPHPAHYKDCVAIPFIDFADLPEGRIHSYHYSLDGKDLGGPSSANFRQVCYYWCQLDNDRLDSFSECYLHLYYDRKRLAELRSRELSTDEISTRWREAGTNMVQLSIFAFIHGKIGDSCAPEEI